MPAVSLRVAVVSRSRTAGRGPPIVASPLQVSVASVSPFATTAVAASLAWKVPLPFASIQPYSVAAWPVELTTGTAADAVVASGAIKRLGSASSSSMPAASSPSAAAFGAPFGSESTSNRA